MGKSGFCSFNGKFPQTEIRGKKCVAVAGLGVITKETPPIFFGFFHDPRANGVQVEIGKTVNKGFLIMSSYLLNDGRYPSTW